MRQVCWAVAVLLVIGPGAASAQTIDAGRGELPLHVPSSYDAATPVPLIVLLHGYTSSGAGQDTYMQVSALKDAYGFILVAPDGTREAGGNRPRFWNASAACCNFSASEVDDVAYLAGLIDAIKADYAIDDKRVYLFGHSNGGFMSYRMAYEHPGAIAAIASLAGADQSLPAPPEPVHVLQIHGTADTAIPYESGSFRDRALPGAKASVESWAAHNGCAATGVDSGALDLDGGLDGPESDVRRYTDGCRPGGSAELWTINGGGHVPALSAHFTRLVVEWLLGHPKP
jgi:polyhydroxybutyrate depolymerase